MYLLSALYLPNVALPPIMGGSLTALKANPILSLAESGSLLLGLGHDKAPGSEVCDR